MRNMTTIKLGKETSAYLSKYFNAEIEHITIEDGDTKLAREITEFIKELLFERENSLKTKAYIYDKRDKLLEIKKEGK